MCLASGVRSSADFSGADGSRIDRVTLLLQPPRFDHTLDCTCRINHMPLCRMARMLRRCVCYPVSEILPLYFVAWVLRFQWVDRFMPTYVLGSDSRQSQPFIAQVWRRRGGLWYPCRPPRRNALSIWTRCGQDMGRPEKRRWHCFGKANSDFSGACGRIKLPSSLTASRQLCIHSAVRMVTKS
jgi:hypothetical protein